MHHRSAPLVIACGKLRSLPCRSSGLILVGLAVANEAVWRLMSTDAWVNFKTFGLTIAMFGFFMAQAGLLKTHGIDKDQA